MPQARSKDSQFFPLWERSVKIAWLLLGVAALLAAYEYLLRPWLARNRAGDLVVDAERVTSEHVLALDPALSRDGKWLAYAAAGEGQSLAIYVRPVSGGRPERLTDTRTNEAAPDFSPDGERIVYQSGEGEGGICIASRGRTYPPRRLVAEGRRPRFSPDGKWVAYYGTREGSALPGGSQLYVVSDGGGEPRRIQPSFLQAQAPVWSPGGKHLLFDGTSPLGENDWWVTPLDEGTAVRTHADAVLRDTLRLWSTPGCWAGEKAYFAGALGEDLDLWELSLSPKDWRASAPRRLTSGSERRSLLTRGRGSRIAYSTIRSSVDVFAAPLEPDTGRVLGDPQRITEGGFMHSVPSVSVDGSKFVYVSNRTGRHDIWFSDTGLKSGKAAASVQPVRYRPVVSADGNYVAYTLGHGDRCTLWLVDLRTKRVTFREDTCVAIWDLAPDGRRILHFSLLDTARRTVGLLEVPSGRRQDVLADPERHVYQARFSSDGRWIAFLAGQHIGAAPAFVAPFRGVPIRPEEWIQVTVEPAIMPTWSPGGKVLYYRSKRDGFDCIWAQRLNAQKRPEGPPAAVLHFHRADLGLYRMADANFTMSLTRDRLVLSLVSHSGSVWLARLRD